MIPLTVMIDARPISDSMGGIGNYTRRLIEAISSTAPSVRLVCLTPDPNMLRRNLTIGEGILVYACDTEREPDRARLASLATEVGASVYHGPSFFLPASIPIPGVVTIHDLAFLHTPAWYPPRFANHLERVTADAVRRATTVIAVSDTVGDELTRRIPDAKGKVVRIYEAPAASASPEAGRLLPFGLKEGGYILAVGVQQRRKNAVGLVRAFARLKASRSLTEKLVLVGGTDCEDPALTPLIRDAGLDSQVVLTGRVSDDDLDAIYRSARLFVHPSLEEGFGLPPLEAMARGIPTIATDGGSLGEVLAEGACLVPAGSDEALAQAVDRLLRDDGERQDWAKRGTARAAVFSWEKTARETVGLYRSMVASSTPAEVRSSIRVGVDARFYNLVRTGTGRYTREILPPLLRSARNADFVLIGPESFDGDFPADVDSIVQHVPAGPETLLNPSWEQYALPSSIQGCDVFLSLTGTLPVARSCKGVAVIHGLSFFDRPEDFPPDLCRYLMRWVSATCRSADLLVAVSRFTQSSLERAYRVPASRIRTIYHGRPANGPLSPSHGQDGTPPPNPYLLFVGSLEPNKEVPRLIEAFSSIASTWPGDLVLAARAGRDLEAVRKQIAGRGLSSRVRLILDPTDEDLGLLYRHASLFVTSASYESFGLPLVEAMAFGVPVVAFALTGIPEVIGEAGVLVPERSPGAFSSAVLSVLQDSQRLACLKRAAFLRAQEFSWDETARQTWNALMEVA